MEKTDRAEDEGGGTSKDISGLRMLRRQFVLKTAPVERLPSPPPLEEAEDGKETEEESEKGTEEEKEAEDEQGTEQTHSQEVDEVTLEELLSSLGVERVQKKEVEDASSPLPSIPPDPAPSPAPPRKISHLGALVNDFCDKWNECALPSTPIFLSATVDTLIVSRNKGKSPRWLPISLLGTPKATWSTAKWTAHAVVTNGGGTLVARLSTATPSLLAHPLSPSNAVWIPLLPATKKCISLSLSSSDAWLVVEGGVELSMGLPQQAVGHSLDCELPLSCISAIDNAVWAIRKDDGSLVVRVGFTRNRRFGEDWVNVTPDGPSRLLSLALIDSSAFLLDSSFALWRATHITEHCPLGHGFYRIPSPLDGLSLDSPPVLAVSPGGVFLATGRRLFHSSSPLAGHRLLFPLPPRLSAIESFAALSAGAYSTEDDSPSSRLLLTLSSNSELVSVRPDPPSILPFPHPNSLTGLDRITSISSCGSRWSFIDGTGRAAFVDASTGEGTRAEGIEGILSLAISSSSVWAVDAFGSVLIGQGPFPPQFWKALPGIRASKVWTSPNGRYVWVRTDEGKLAARGGIDERRQEGTLWVTRNDEWMASSLAVGDSVVYALTEEGTLARLRGLNAANPAGREWAWLWKGEESFSALSLDYNCSLWLIRSDRRLAKHEISIYK